jgi:hypothetical protein
LQKRRAWQDGTLSYHGEPTTFINLFDCFTESR